MSIHSNARALRTAALVAKMQHDLLHSCVDGGTGHEGFQADNAFVALGGIHPEEMVSISQIVDGSYSRNAEFRHFGRHNKSALHCGIDPQEPDYSTALKEANHAVHGCAIGLSRNRYHQTQNVSRHGFESVNGAATIGRSTPANDQSTYPKITIADFDIPHSIAVPSRRSDAPGNVFVAPLTLSGAPL